MLPSPLPAPDRPVLLAGPTASGKSALALALAQVQGRTVVNADALQVHAAWQVLTARPGAEDLARAPHALYGHVPMAAPYSVGHWLREVAPLLARRPAPVIVGGTGLFFTALTEGLAEIPAIPAEIRARALARLECDGLDRMAAELDPDTRARIDTRNPARVLRAWEVAVATGQGLAAWQDRTGPPLLAPGLAERWVLDPGPILTHRIATRFDAMLAEGALDEARAALPHWPGPESRATLPPWARAIGAAELVAHLRGQMSWDMARQTAIAATRRYAKRQRTWLRNRLGDWHRLPAP